MSNEIIKIDAEIISKLVLNGDVALMSQSQKVSYYRNFCEQLGLNPLTQPFQLIKFQGKERLYATKDCTEQLRKIHGVSITDVSSMKFDSVFVVTAKAMDKTGKTDAATGAVNIEGLKGEALANALMKAETKAKRRVTLSICGLGILDESEFDTMPAYTTEAVEVVDEVGQDNREFLLTLVESSTYDERQRAGLRIKISKMVTIAELDKAKTILQANQTGIDGVVNPSQKDINGHLKKVTA